MFVLYMVLGTGLGINAALPGKMEHVLKRPISWQEREEPLSSSLLGLELDSKVLLGQAGPSADMSCEYRGNSSPTSFLWDSFPLG